MNSLSEIARSIEHLSNRIRIAAQIVEPKQEHESLIEEIILRGAAHLLSASARELSIQVSQIKSYSKQSRGKKKNVKKI